MPIARRSGRHGAAAWPCAGGVGVRTSTIRRALQCLCGAGLHRHRAGDLRDHHNASRGVVGTLRAREFRARVDYDPRHPATCGPAIRPPCARRGHSLAFVSAACRPAWLTGHCRSMSTPLPATTPPRYRKTICTTPRCPVIMHFAERDPRFGRRSRICAAHPCPCLPGGTRLQQLGIGP